ncbi:4Fe-4S dicluster domain-containing protein [Candidatus Binatia bacterium]|jgi:ferredoxin|nr:4Fe-4S dicluster domain-containing protein [Candidatus Binatia bacterium]
MATMITDECINCGACEPECPNTAIYQGGVEWLGLDGSTHPALTNEFFYIVPEKCTECVGFFDHEACAAVCPVDCCVPNPNIPESESVLLARAAQIHPDKTFGPDSPSRFKGDGGAAAAPTGAAAAPAAAAGAAAAPAKPAAAPAPVAAPAAAPAGPAVVVSPEDALAAAVPDLDDWEVPLRCFRCEGEFSVAYQYIRPGVVLHCPHCVGSFVPNTALYQALSKRLSSFHGSWHKSFEEFRARRAKELASFEASQKAALEKLEADLRKIATGAELAGAPQKQRGWL